MASTETHKPVVLIYDDDRGSALAIKQQLGAIDNIELRLLDQAKDQVELLEQRRRLARSSEQGSYKDTAFDEADILIVDYDLTASGEDQSGPAETGERVAYLARCYSQCGTIVALNQFNVTATFDLSLIGHISSYADINISGDQIGNPALWGGQRDGYAPWSWPDLKRAPSLQKEREALLSGRLENRALAVVGLDDPEVFNGLSRNQLAWLSPNAAPGDVTVMDVIRKGRIGFRPNDEPWAEGGLERVAAARLGKWLERLVLPGQNILVDAPHLVSRFPSLAVAERSWDETTVLGPDGVMRFIDDELGSYRFSANKWLSRPAWIWPKLSTDRSIDEVRDPFSPIKVTKPFTEDSSVFRDHDRCRPFAADVEPFSRRFVTRTANSGEEDSPPYAGQYGLGVVQYQPQLRFAL
jgi:hypothetical protein